MRVSGTDFMGSQGEVAFEWRGVHGRPPLASPRGRQGSEQVAVTAESRARRPERFPSESCGPWPQWGRGCKVSGRGGLPHPIFLSQGVLPGTVQPAHGCQHHGSEDRPGGPSSPSPLRSSGRVGGSRVTAQQTGPESWQSGPRPLQPLLQEASRVAPSPVEGSQVLPATLEFLP